MTSDTYRGWKISPPDWPAPWTAYGPDYDASYEGEEDGWVDNGHKADAPTREALIAEIDAWFEENVKMTEEQIKHMVNRFLSWKLPSDFQPDGGVSLKQPFGAHWPVGTNLLTAPQAEAMVRHMLEGLP